MEKIGEKISYDRSKKLGEGGFAIVYEGLFEDSKKVAVKRILKDRVNYPSITKETKIMLEVSDHQNILRYICYDTDDNFVFIVTELCSGTLSEWVEGTYKGPEIGMNERKILYQVTKGLAYLHPKNIVHRDIKPTNILIVVPDTYGGLNEPQMKIADFGLSKVLKRTIIGLKANVDMLWTSSTPWIICIVLLVITHTKIFMTFPC